MLQVFYFQSETPLDRRESAGFLCVSMDLRRIVMSKRRLYVRCYWCDRQYGKRGCQRAAGQGPEVRVIGRNESRLRPFAEKGAEPFVADLTDQAALRRAFSGATAVYAMIPPDTSQPDVPAYQSRIRESIAEALEQAAVKYAVSLSSLGADKPEGTGPVDRPAPLRAEAERHRRPECAASARRLFHGEHSGSSLADSDARHSPPDRSTLI